MKPFAPILALIWGGCWAAILQATSLGRYLAARRTWLTVVVGVGVDLLLLRWLLRLTDWLKVVLIVALSSVGIIGRSVLNEWADHQAAINRIRTGGTGRTGGLR